MVPMVPLGQSGIRGMLGYTMIHIYERSIAMSRITVRWNGLDGLINDKPFLPSCSPEQQAEVLMELAEQDGERLGSSERRLILEYARAVLDYHVASSAV